MYVRQKGWDGEASRGRFDTGWLMARRKDATRSTGKHWSKFSKFSLQGELQGASRTCDTTCMTKTPVTKYWEEPYLQPEKRLVHCKIAANQRLTSHVNGVNDQHPRSLQMAEGQTLAQEGSVRSIALETPLLRQDTRLCCQCQKSLMLHTHRIVGDVCQHRILLDLSLRLGSKLTGGDLRACPQLAWCTTPWPNERRR